MPPEGLQMSVLEADGHSERAKEHLVRVAAREGFPFISPAFVPNTHLALAMGEYARDRGDDVHRAVHAAIFNAYFALGRDIGRKDVLLQVAEEVGIATGEVEQAWAERTFDERLHNFFHLGLSLGLESTPASLVCSELIIGSRPYDVFKDAAQRCLDSAAVARGRAGQAPGGQVRQTLT